jgi:hypothetical protein
MGNIPSYEPPRPSLHLVWSTIRRARLRVGATGPEGRRLAAVNGHCESIGWRYYCFQRCNCVICVDLLFFLRLLLVGVKAWLRGRVVRFTKKWHSSDHQQEVWEAQVSNYVDEIRRLGSVVWLHSEASGYLSKKEDVVLG